MRQERNPNRLDVRLWVNDDRFFFIPVFTYSHSDILKDVWHVSNKGILIKRHYYDVPNTSKYFHGIDGYYQARRMIYKCFGRMRIIVSPATSETLYKLFRKK